MKRIGQYIHLIGGQGAINLQSKSDLILIRGYMQETFLCVGGRKLYLTMNVENVIPLVCFFQIFVRQSIEDGKGGREQSV